MDLELFKVGASGRIALGDLLDGVEYAQAEKNVDGTIIISPVRIRPATGRSTDQATPDQGDLDA